MTPWHQVRNTWWNEININSKNGVKIFRGLKRVLKYSAVAMKDFSRTEQCFICKSSNRHTPQLCECLRDIMEFFATEIVL